LRFREDFEEGVEDEPPLLLGPVVPSFRALSGRLKFTVRRHKFNQDSLSPEAIQQPKINPLPPLEAGPSYALTPNTVELISTHGALFPRGGPVQDPVITPSLS